MNSTEGDTLPDLRNDLICSLNEPDKALAVAAKEMSERLLIDITNSGCQMSRMGILEKAIHDNLYPYSTQEDLKLLQTAVSLR